jgi:hypothetical protein
MTFSKKSQVTLFIIIVIFILVIFVVFAIVITKMNEDTNTINQGRIAEPEKAFNHFELYMQSCLDKSLKDSLYYIGRQGGFIFKGQDGSIIDFDIRSASYNFSDTVNKEVFNITYVSDNILPWYVMNEPNYPCYSPDLKGIGYTYLKYPDCYKNYSHDMANSDILFFGSYQLLNNSPINNVDIPLCSKTQVVNDTSVMYAKKAKGESVGDSESILVTVCEASQFEEKNKYSIQNQMESFIKYRLEDCYAREKDYISQYMEAEVTSKKDFNVSVNFGDDYTTATLQFPLSLHFKKSDTTARTVDFFSQVNVRLKTIYAALYGNNIKIKQRLDNTSTFSRIDTGIIDMDLRNISYDLEKDPYSFFNNYTIFNLTIQRLYDEYGSLIKVTDLSSRLGGDYYQYYVREFNRRPALDYYSLHGTNDYDIYAYVNDSIIITPLAYDPDDEGKKGRELRYYYIVDQTWRFRNETFYNNSLYLNGEDDEMVCMHPKYGVTKYRCSRIVLNQSDLGEHTLKIVVEDMYGLKDSQIIRVVIDQKPNTTFEISGVYSDIQKRYITDVPRFIVSREDPFIINTSGSLVSIGPFNNQFKWQDTVNGNIPDLADNDLNTNFTQSYPITFDATDYLVNPGYSPYTNYSIYSAFVSKTSKNLGDDTNNQVLSNLAQFGYYYAIFDINQRWGYPIKPIYNRETSIKLDYYRHNTFAETRTEDIYVVDCIPHRNDDTPSYPFNLIRTLGSDRKLNPYEANHTCCAAGIDDDELDDPTEWRVKSNNEICYSSEEIGPYDEFMLYEHTNISSQIFWSLNFNYEIVMDPQVIYPLDMSSDRYVRKLEGKCAGRGNVCEPTEYTIKKIPYCGLQGTVTNYTIRHTQVPGGEYYSGLCMCKDNGVKLYNFSDTSISEIDYFCCFDDNEVPSKLKDKPCIIPSCVKDMNNGVIVKIGTGAPYLQRTNNEPSSYCLCGDEEVYVPSHMNDRCCYNGIYYSLSYCD